MALLSLYAQSLIGTSFSSEASVSDLLALLGSRTEGRNEEMVATARQRPGCGLLRIALTMVHAPYFDYAGFSIVS